MQSQLAGIKASQISCDSSSSLIIYTLHFTNARSYTYNKMQFTYMINIVLAALLVGRSGCNHSNFKHLCVD